MSEEQNASTERLFNIQKIYIKDVSFETPNSPEIFTLAWGEPKVEFNLSSSAQQIQEGVFEVSLTVTVTVKIEQKTAYLVEITQAGIFSASGFQNEEIGHLLGSYCPNLLFPYAREAVSDLVGKGGFPPMLLAPVNFDALYAQHIQQMQQKPESVTSH
jgi:preprotein translocase subunit SecB